MSDTETKHSDTPANGSRIDLPSADGFRMPAEWEPHERTWLAWPMSEDWPGKLESVRWVFCEMARLLHQTERVGFLIPSHADEVVVSDYLRRAGVRLGRIDFVAAETDRTWTRDNLPQFVVNGAGALGAVKFAFNGWGRYPDYELDDLAGIQVAKLAAPQVWQPQLRGRRFVLEGGSIDVDGQGTLLTTRRCLLGSPFTRNPGATQQEVEQMLSSHLGVTQFIWLEDGIAGDDTSGHIDDFARFVAPGIVVVAQGSDASDPDTKTLAAAREALEQARDARGARLEVVSLPVPAPVFYEGERLPASYANFYIANEQVLVPTFNDPKDRIALGILSDLFPGRSVTGVYARDLVVGLGTLHCSTQQQPAGASRSLLPRAGTP
jgi:agmatine deiminase